MLLLLGLVLCAPFTDGNGEKAQGSETKQRAGDTVPATAERLRVWSRRMHYSFSSVTKFAIQ